MSQNKENSDSADCLDALKLLMPEQDIDCRMAKLELTEEVVVWNQRSYNVYFDFPNGESVGAHIELLSAHSPVFTAMFQTEKENAGSSATRITLWDQSLDTFKIMLSFFYTGKLPNGITVEEYQDLYRIADKYYITQLKEIVINHLERDLMPSNAIRVLWFSDMYSLDVLKQSCLSLIKSAGKAVVASPKYYEMFFKKPDLALIVSKLLIGDEENCSSNYYFTSTGIIVHASCSSLFNDI